MERYSEVKRSGMLEGRMQLEKSLMLWKSLVNTYRSLTKFTTGSLGVRAIGMFRFDYYLSCVLSC